MTAKGSEAKKMTAKLDHLVIYASDLANSATFYGAVLSALGFQKTRDWVWLNDDGFAVDLRSAKPEGRPYDRYGPGLNHFGFATPSRDAFDQIQAELRAAGVDLPDVQEIDGALCLFLPDPDGLRVEISWELNGG